MQKAWKILYKNHQIDRIAEISDTTIKVKERKYLKRRKNRERERKRENISRSIPSRISMSSCDTKRKEFVQSKEGRMTI